ncbi:MAG: hypothetical protein WKG07_15570 [Hymenobacter sp.]
MLLLAVGGVLAHYAQARGIFLGQWPPFAVSGPVFPALHQRGRRRCSTCS